jgi:protein-disulfide isomerase
MQTTVAHGAPTYTLNVKAILYNRILIFLGFVGIFIAGVLSLAKVMDVQVPCGGASSCETVTNDPSSMFLGIIPVAYIGLGAYLFFTALAIWRSMPKTNRFAKFTLYGYIASAFGTAVSIGLQAYSILFIGAMCKWCLASAVTMTATMIVYVLLHQQVSELSPEALQEARNQSAKGDFLVSSGFGALAVLALAVEGYQLRYGDSSKGRVLTSIPKNYPLIPSHPFIYGDVNAPVKVIEFADLNCPACQKDSPMLKEFARQHEGKMCVVFRNCPLPMHQTSQLAALIDCYAAEKGKFWDYTLAVMGTKEEIKDPNMLFTIASQVGLDVDDLKRRMANTKDPLYAKLAQDENAAAVVGVNSTPTFIIELPNQPPKEFTGGGMFDALHEKPYTDYLGKA